MCILSQITQITQRGMQQAALSRREIQVVWGCCSYCCSVVCLRKSARDIWGFFWVYWLSPLPCYSPADSADDADECSRLHYIAEKDRLGWWWGSFGYNFFCCYGSFAFCLRLSTESARDLWGFLVPIVWQLLCEYFLTYLLTKLIGSRGCWYANCE